MRPVDEPAYRELLSRLRSARREAGYSQSQAAELLVKGQSFVSKCESGERRIDPIELLAFAKLYRKPLSYFIPEAREP